MQRAALPDNSSTSSLKSYFLDVKPAIEKLPQQLSATSKSVAQALFDDAEKAHRLYKDEVYSLDDWRRAKAWYRHLPNLEGVEILRGYAWIVFYCFIVSVAVCCYHQWLEPLGAPAWGATHEYIWQCFNLTSFALALLLVFRTNSSYGRWWEARILWGSQINMTRDIVRRAISWFPPEEEALLMMFARWSITMSYGLKSSLRGQDPVPELQRILPERELDWASRSSHLPTTIAQILSDILALIDLPQFQRVALDDEIQRYVDILGSCERICKTPIHRNWTSHTSRFCLVWLTFLPWALWPVYGWATPGIQAVISWLLLGIENIGVQIEEPFAVLALHAYCGVCERSVQALMSQRRGALRLVRLVRGDLLGSRANSYAACGADARMRAARDEDASGSGSGSSPSPPRKAKRCSIELG